MSSTTTWPRHRREHLDAWLERLQKRCPPRPAWSRSPATLASIGISLSLVLLIALSMVMHHVVERARAQQLADAQWQQTYWKCASARNAVMRQSCMDQLQQPEPPSNLAEATLMKLAATTVGR